MIADWYATHDLGDGVTLIWERYIKPHFRANMWYVRGRNRSVLIDAGFDLVSLIDAISALRELGLLALGTHTHCDHVGGHHEFACRAPGENFGFAGERRIALPRFRAGRRAGGGRWYSQFRRLPADFHVMAVIRRRGETTASVIYNPVGDDGVLA